MAFARSGLSRVGGSGGGSVWLYATEEAVATDGETPVEGAEDAAKTEEGF